MRILTVLLPLALPFAAGTAHAGPAQELQMGKAESPPPAASHGSQAHNLVVGSGSTIREATHVFGSTAEPVTQCVYCFNADDNADTAPRGMSNLYAGLTVNGAEATGHKTAMTAVIAVTGRTGNRAQPQSYYVAQAGRAIARVNDNGTAEQAVGNLFGGNDIVNLERGATFWNSIVGREITYSAQSGSDLRYKEGFKVVIGQDDGVQGASGDYGYSLGAQTGGSQPGVRYGFAIGTLQGVWPIDPRKGILFGTDPSKSLTNAQGVRPEPRALGGIDLAGVAFGGFAYRSNGFQVDGEGATSAKTLTLREVAAEAVAVPSSGSQTIFLDATDHKLKRKDATGAVTIIG